MAKGTYHHGDLRPALLKAAAEHIAESGVETLSLRELARRAGVSHAAPAHHFGDRRGLLTALATEAFGLLADQLEAAGPDFREIAVAYVRFAVSNPGHFKVMFRGDLLSADDARLAAARQGSAAKLRTGATAGRGPDTQLAAWSLVHGFASLWLDGALKGSPLADDADPETLARRMVARVGLE
ncbi:MAG TPA: TetR/AcrR family transcriptional regulator [Stackebrandtia sp.]|jgi:AcrR family transcriptional regulator|uniref:TetR/AcrR family transcriptional regulator n=1 Tax=Stackebrandtia sp. TaxID=2023065 RepID=UPI002D408FF8|nr:TetR/AcrR family transcriptional regulator [Stackebrandtia sp.]HZE38947.1 TetR/AcrR family transcriptional regulator [Stackebrandtia sp.]